VVDVIQYNTSTLNRYIDGDDILEHWYCTAQQTLIMCCTWFCLVQRYQMSTSV